MKIRITELHPASHHIKMFWIGSLVATIGANISLSASLLNLYRLSGTAEPILMMMFIEALVPLCTIKIIMHLFSKVKSEFLFFIAALFGIVGALIQFIGYNVIMLQLFGIIFAAFATAIQKPLMMELAVRITDDEANRMKVNNIVTFIAYVGLLLGYISSGFIITYVGYQACFIVNAMCFTIFGIITLFTRFPNLIQNFHKEIENSIKSTSTNKRSALILIFIFSFAQWLTGGCINVLEIPFAQKIMNASELNITFLFFSSAAGAIMFSILTHKKKILVSLRALAITSIVGGLSILAYVEIARFYMVIPILFCYGFIGAYQGFLSMCLIQKYSTYENISKNTVYLNTMIQVITLLSAAAGVFIAQWTGEQKACLIFTEITLLISVISFFFLKKY